jgi:hypothetical protein
MSLKRDKILYKLFKEQFKKEKSEKPLDKMTDKEKLETLQNKMKNLFKLYEYK